MNLFFGIKDSEINSELQIPLFKNKDIKPTDLILYAVSPNSNEWKVENLKALKSDEFYIIKNDIINNNKFFFLANENDLNDYNKLELKNFNSFTNTSPAYRANLNIFIKNGGFSSYQSEYPFEMCTKNGSILSPIYNLLDPNADKNIIFLINIFEKPIHENFEAYLINLEEKKIITKFLCKTNNVNKILIERNFIKPNIFLFTKKYIGIPIFLTIKNNHLSFEHTHPPHEYILDNEKFKIVSDLKNKFNKIIDKENN